MIKSEKNKDWGNMLNEYYQLTRAPLAGEIDFWKSQIKKGDSVIEIGAGQGFITKHIVQKKPSKLLLVEPCKSSSKYLEAIQTNESVVSISYDLFEETKDIFESDCIIFPYDSLPMVSKENYNLFFKKIYDSLADDGKFIFHISTKEWNLEYLNKFKSVYKTTKVFPSGKNVTVLAWAEKLSDSCYTKFFCFIDIDTNISEYYEMKTNILNKEFILELCEKNNLQLVHEFKSFDEVITKDDLIFTLAKSKRS
jgi:cyclopropane fatty-acyl-phospholipid synthase-like methyltransferase